MQPRRKTATALGDGTGTFTLGDGALIDNSSGGAIDMTADNPITISGDFRFFGSYDLDLGNGAIDRKLEVHVAKISRAAREKIEAAGGTVTLTEVATPSE